MSWSRVAGALARSTLTVSGLSLTFLTYERSLIPLYGENATELYMQKVFLAVVILAVYTPTVAKLSLRHSMLLLGILASLAPNVTYWTAALTARKKEAVWGPLVTHFVALAPMTYLQAASLIRSDGSSVIGNAWPENQRSKMLDGRGLTVGACHVVATNLARLLFPKFMALNEVSESSIYTAIAGVAFAASSLIEPAIPSTASPKGKKKVKSPKQVNSSSSLTRTAWNYLPMALLVILPFARPFMHSPVLERPLSEPFNHPTRPVRILSSTQSVTGLIVVGEGVPSAKFTSGEAPSLRYLRASHSLLGGVWVGDQVKLMEGATPANDSFGTPLGDSIYSAFVLQEAARLVSDRKVEFSNALIIGLGAGISGQAFNKHQISTTIVEIDPAVYEAARKYFGLPDPGPGQVFLEDARGWVAKRRVTLEVAEAFTGTTDANQLYSLVVHDCFSGGGVPPHIFTVEFFEDLKAIMHPEGILALNFAGKLASESSQAILHTLSNTFPQCRAFHDSFEELTEEKYETEFINMVFFCSPSSIRITFREPVEADYLGSYLRRHVLSSLPNREVNLSQVRANISSLNKEAQNDILLTDKHNPLGKWQDEHALEHWRLMRDVLPDIFWETY